jgi:hypothetical protein
MNGANGMSDIEGKAAQVAASESGGERVSNTDEESSDFDRKHLCKSVFIRGCFGILK